MVENKYYERKIKYLDLMENGERVSGAGFIKTEVKGMDINFTIVVKGLHPTDTYERDVMLQAGDGEFVMGRIALKEGQGEFKYHTVMDHSQLQGIRIALGGIREICCKWQEEKRSSVGKKNAVKESVASENGWQGYEISGNVADGEKETKQLGKKKSREIQLIPWDEIKVVEESLERVQKIMSKSAEDGAWRAAERTVEREMMEKETASRDPMAREMAKGGKEAREATERAAMGGGTAEGRKETREATERAAMEKGSAERRWEARETAKGRWEAGEATERGTAEERRESGEATERGTAEERRESGEAAERGTAEERRELREAAERGTAEGRWEARETAERGTAEGRWESRETAEKGTAEGRWESRETAEKGTAEERWEAGKTAERGISKESWEVRETAEKGTEKGRTEVRGIVERAAMEREMAVRRTVAKERVERGNTARGRAGSEMGGKGTAERRASERDKMMVRERRVAETTGKSGRTGGNSSRTGGKSMNMENRTPVRLMEDKWQQIWAIYPHIHPFQDEREYLSISPADFVLLPDEAYRAANNSFLLHGYYNYDHLILTRIEKRGEVFYYIGVPGNYYEREKQVAIMFGFESFECGTEPAQAGDFGYYMMRTQL